MNMRNNFLGLMNILILVFLAICPLQAAEDQLCVECEQTLLQAKNPVEIYAAFEKCKAPYFQNHNYSVFIDCIDAIAKKKKNLKPYAQYYTALARYNQLKYLEQTQGWDEYFSRGSEYRQQISENLDKAYKSIALDEPLAVYSRLLLWQVHKDQSDVLEAQSLDNLMETIRVYVKDSANLNVVSDSADTLLAYGQKAKARELYKLYAQKIIAMTTSSEDLQNRAYGFYKQNNMELAQALYSCYIDNTIKSASKDKAKLELLNIARLFSYKTEGGHDLDFAEQVFEKIEIGFGKDVFDEELMYLRGLNFEKSKDFKKAKVVYLSVLERFPQTILQEELYFKLGLINLYVQKDIPQAKQYLEKLASSTPVTYYAVAAMYHLGLVSQWQNEFSIAKDYFVKLVQAAGNKFKHKQDLAKRRLQEIDDIKPMDYNLKLFLDASLGDGPLSVSTGKLELNASAAIVTAGQPLNIRALAYPPESGCLAEQMQYYWSGDIGSGKPVFDNADFATSFDDPGTEVVSLVVTTPAGVIDKGMEFIDVK